MIRRSVALIAALLLLSAATASAQVAFDAASESHTGTTGSTSEASFGWTHTPVGTPKGALVYVFNLSSATDTVTSVTYGASTMTAVTSGFATDTATEPGFCKAYFLGASVPTGAQTVTVTRTNNANVMYAVAITVTAAASTTETAGVATLNEDQAVGITAVNDGSPGTNSVRFYGLYSGGASVLSAGVGSTSAQSIDVGANTASTFRETTAGQGSRNVGPAAGASDDVAAVLLAIREPPAAPARVPRLTTLGVGLP